MLELSNETDYSVGLYPGWNKDREPQMTCIVKQGYSFDFEGNVEPLSSSTDIIEVDQYYTKPHESSLMEVNELSPYKLGSETYLYGTAYPEANKSAMEVEFNIQFNDGKRWNKTLRVAGKRVWNKILLGYVMSKPELLTPTVLQYENAFGGCNPEDEKESFSYNPIGKGFNKASGWKVMNLELPTIEIGPKFLKSPPQQQIPAGYGPLPVYWEPRKKEIGKVHPTPEEQGGCPFTSESKISMHNVAPIDQRFPMPFVGGEKVLLKGFFNAEGTKRVIEFNIPKTNIDIDLLILKKKVKLSPLFDTLIIDTEKFEFYTISRVAISWNILDNRVAWVLVNKKHNTKELVNLENTRNYG